MKKEHNEEIKFRNIYKAPMIPNRKSSKLPEKYNINSNGHHINSTIDSMEDDDWKRFVGLE